MSVKNIGDTNLVKVRDSGLFDFHLSSFSSTQTGQTRPRIVGWHEQIGTKNELLLPSGTTLLTGDLAIKKALALAEKAWSPAKQNQSKDYHGLLDLLTSNPKETSYQGMGYYKSGANRLVPIGMYGGVILVAQESELNPKGLKSKAEIEENKVRLVKKAVRCFEEGVYLSPGKEIGKSIFDQAMATRYPLVVRVTEKEPEWNLPEQGKDEVEEDEVDENDSHFLAADASLLSADKIERNYDYLSLNVSRALINEKWEYIPTWANLFHELAHRILVNENRSACMAASADKKNPFPYDNIQHCPNTHVYKTQLEMEQFVVDNYDRRLAEKALIPVRQSYTGDKGFLWVDDPIHPKMRISPSQD